RPFPDVADHVVQAVVTRRKRADGRGARVAIFEPVLEGEPTLPVVRHHAAAGCELAAPCVRLAIAAGARGEFPFRFSRQLFACPARVRFSVGECNVHDRMIEQCFDAAFGAPRMSPVRAEREAPPSERIVEWYGMTRRHEE